MLDYSQDGNKRFIHSFIHTVTSCLTSGQEVFLKVGNTDYFLAIRRQQTIVVCLHCSIRNKWRTIGGITNFGDAFFSQDLLDDYFHSFLIVGEVGNTVQNSNRYFGHYITKILLHKQRNCC